MVATIASVFLAVLAQCVWMRCVAVTTTTMCVVTVARARQASSLTTQLPSIVNALSATREPTVNADPSIVCLTRATMAPSAPNYGLEATHVLAQKASLVRAATQTSTSAQRTATVRATHAGI